MNDLVRNGEPFCAKTRPKTDGRVARRGNWGGGGRGRSIVALQYVSLIRKQRSIIVSGPQTAGSRVDLGVRGIILFEPPNTSKSRHVNSKSKPALSGNGRVRETGDKPRV